MVLLEEKEEDRVFVRDQLGLKESDIKRDVEILKEWLKKQPHLPQDKQSDSFFEHFLLRNKGRVEKAKQNIDLYYTIKTIWPDSYENLQEVRPGTLSVDMFPMLQLTEDKHIIVIVRYRKNSAINFNMLEAVKQCFAVLEVLNKHVYCSGVEILWDLTELTLELFKRFRPNMLQRFFTGVSASIRGGSSHTPHYRKIRNELDENYALIMCQGLLIMYFIFFYNKEVYTNRVFGIHCYNPPSWIELLLNVTKHLVKPKIFDRITLQNNHDSLLKVLPKKFLPSDYGGDQPSIQEVLAQWDEIIKENKQFLEELPTLKSNEKLRVGKCQIDTRRCLEWMGLSKN